MSCGSCSSGSCSSGCGSKTAKAGTSLGCQSNGTCGTSGCNKMNVFDWLGNMELPRNQRFNIAEVRFKGNRKEFFRRSAELELFTGDPVVVEVANGGFHIGHVSLQGELVRLQMSRKKVRDDADIKRIYRIANTKDLERLEEFKNKEMTTLYRSRQIVDESKLDMKVSDVEYQADGMKATFYYSAEDRIDFRELIKSLAAEFKVRIEMRQISLRQEAGRLGGIGSCGRELCCSTWLSDFKSVSTAAARYQNLSLNPSKLSGQCGRLKCCLNYELQTYLDALVDIPKVEKPLLTEKGTAFLQKTDIFRKMMWFSYDQESVWHPLSVDRVSEIMALNAQGKIVESLLADTKKAISMDFKNDLSFNSKDQKNISKKRDQKKKNPNLNPNQTLNQNPNQNQIKPQNPNQRPNQPLNQEKEPSKFVRPERNNNRKEIQKPLVKNIPLAEVSTKTEDVAIEKVLTLEEIVERSTAKPLKVEGTQTIPSEKRKRKRRRKKRPSATLPNQEIKQEKPISELAKPVIAGEKPVIKNTEVP
ncbi:MAG: Signal peptidase-like protein, partial [Bacteroidetes bacterium]